MTAEERIDALEERLARMEEMLTRALSGGGSKETPRPAPARTVRHTYKQEMENLRKAMELSRLLHTTPRAVFRAAQKKFFADGGMDSTGGPHRCHAGRERMMEERAKTEELRAKDRKRMRRWVIAVAAVTVVWGALELRGSMDRYEAGRIRERKEAAERIAARCDAGERYFDSDLGVWVIPDAPKHIRVKRPQRVAAKEE